MANVLHEYDSPIDFRPQILEASESERANGWMRVRGRFQMADTKNGNGRIYSQALWSRVLGESSLLERVQNRQMRGELEHPADGVTNIGRVSHIVTGLKQEGNEIVGEALILNTPAGRILQELFRAKSSVGVSSRGRGTSYNRQGIEYVSEQDFQLDTFDFVDKPSTPGAFPALVESQVEKTYLTEAHMDAKLAEIRRFQVLAHEIQRDAGGANIEKLDSFSAQITEACERVSVLKSHNNDLAKDGGDALDLLASAKETVAQRRQAHYFQESARLDVRVEAAKQGAQLASSGSGQRVNESSTTPTGYVPVSLLEESEQHRRFYQESATELARRLDEGAVDGNKWRAARDVVVEAVRRCAERDSELGALLHEREELLERLGAAQGLIEQIVSRNDEGRLLARLREAISDCPDLARFRAQYDEAIEEGCSLDELDRMIHHHAHALSEMGLGYEDDDEDEFSAEPDDEMGMGGDDMDMGGGDEWGDSPDDGGDMDMMDDPDEMDMAGSGCPDGDSMEMEEPEMGMGDDDEEWDDGEEERYGESGSTPHVRYESELPRPGSVDAQPGGKVLTEASATKGADGRRHLQESHADPRVSTARRVLNRTGWK